jgi:hypothetical protein
MNEVEIEKAERRRAVADEHIASLQRHSRQLVREGAYRDAQEADEAAAAWDFWAAYGVTPEQWDAANAVL